MPIMLAGCIGGGVKHSGDSSSTNLEMKVHVINLEELKSSASQKGRQLVIEIRNIGARTVWLPTREIGPFSMGRDGGWQLMQFSTDGYISTRDGFRIPKAKSDLGIVELRPREAIILDHVFNDPLPTVVAVQYSISKDFAERYGVWHGMISAEGVEVK
jgi:hypothetical protein